MREINRLNSQSFGNCSLQVVPREQLQQTELLHRETFDPVFYGLPPGWTALLDQA